jgi:PhzF family phenazine biosynthesis protein
LARPDSPGPRPAGPGPALPEIPIWQVDAFTSEAFRGNPAAVCFPGPGRDDAWHQAVAAEMNLSETAFLLPACDAWDLRWFTPALEVDLCGHATLASAHVLGETGRLAPGAVAVFRTRSGELRARRAADGAIELDFPALESEPGEAPADLVAAVGGAPVAAAHVPRGGPRGNDWILEYADEAALRALTPDFAGILAAGGPGVMATAPGEPPHDFVSRYFVPIAGIDEDPVTGSMHCALGPYWGRKRGADRFRAHQASARGGEVGVELVGDRVKLTGRAVTVLRGTLLG